MTLKSPLRATSAQRFRCGVGLLAAALLTGCAAVGPNYVAPELATDPEARGVAEITLSYTFYPTKGFKAATAS